MIPRGKSVQSIADLKDKGLTFYARHLESIGVSEVVTAYSEKTPAACVWYRWTDGRTALASGSRRLYERLNTVPA